MQNLKPNIPKGEQKAMEELTKRKGIIITNGDKIGAAATMDVKKYINIANRQLSDKRNCKILQDDPTLQVISLITQMTGLKAKTYLLKNWLTD